MKDRLTKEQSERLITLGVPKERASEYNVDDYMGHNQVQGGLIIYGTDIPIFSLSDLLSLLPKEIDDNQSHSLNIAYIRNEWWAEYISYITEEAWIQKGAIELIDCLYELLCWTINEKYLTFESK